MNYFVTTVRLTRQSKKTTEVITAQIVVFTMGAKYSITEVCPHDIAVIRTLTAECGCETTAEFCAEYGEQLTKPKIEC